MKRFLITFVCALLMCMTLSSCHDSKTFHKADGTEFVAEPYGWANDYKKIEGVQYEPVLGNIVWSVFGMETVIVPVWLTGWAIMEPVAYDPNYDKSNENKAHEH